MKNKSISGLPNIVFRLLLAWLLLAAGQQGMKASSGSEFVTPPVFRPAPCEFSTPMQVEILAEDGCTIYYSTDGLTPVVDKTYRYNGPILISTTTTVKAMAVDENGNRSDISTATYTCTRHGIGEDYNPDSPGNPGLETDNAGKYYKLTVVANPSGAATTSGSSDKLRAGYQQYVYTYSNGGFEFLNWTIEGEVVSTSESFYYVMPEHDVTIVANYAYNPTSPGNPSPEEQKVKHPVVVRAIPSIAASFSNSGKFDMEENTSQYIYAYPGSGWKMQGWTCNGQEQPSNDLPLRVTMGEKALDIAVYFVYEPKSPANPSANYYNPHTGQVIVDDFTPGNLYSALWDLLGYDYSNVSTLIVKGKINSNDIGCAGYFQNASTIDFSRTGGMDGIPSYCFSSMNVSSLALPSSITNIDYYAFNGCNNLASLTLFAEVPPVCDSYAFSGFTNKSNCTLYVPASAVELYANDKNWKDFTILPITSDVHVLQVNLPEDASDGRYKNNTLEIVNINSGVRQKYVVSDRLLYTFNGLQQDEQYNIYMYSKSGLEIGRIENVVIPERDIEVIFESLKPLYTVFAKAVTPAGEDVTGEVTVEWLKPSTDGTAVYLRKAQSLGEVPEGQNLLCRIGLNSRLGTIYETVPEVDFTVRNGSNTCLVELKPLRSITLSGVVVDTDNLPLSDASVSITQNLNGKFPKTYTGKTDKQGKWNLTVLDAPATNITYSAPECVNVVNTLEKFDEGISEVDLGKTIMKSIVGARVSYGFTYRAADSEEVENHYSDYQNVAFEVFNLTQDRSHADVSVQYPVLAVLDENINAGDRLRLTAKSKTGAFNPIEAVVTVDENRRADAAFEIVGKGGIRASFEMTDNPKVVAMLYNAKGELVKKQGYSEAQTTFADLDDGNYTLVSMGQSDLMNSVLRLSNFGEVGLIKGKDYVENTVKVETGKISEVKNTEIPAFDESLFYYTSSDAYFTANKASLTSGEYLTLRSSVNFKTIYKDKIESVELLVDLPQDCEFVEGSVMQGPNKIPYTLNDNRLTIPLLKNYQSQVRFCVVPSHQGPIKIVGNVSFAYNGKDIVQPLGNVNAEVKALEIQAPEIISKPEFFVKGYGDPDSRVTIKDSEGNTIGSGRADKNGFWSVKCTLYHPVNLSGYAVYALLENPSGVEIITETKFIKYNLSVITPIEVKGVSEDVTEGEIKFDFVNTPDGAYYYTIIASDGGSITFLIYLTNNNPDVVKNMVLYNHRVDGNVDLLYPQYDEKKDCWFVTMDDLNMQNVPINVSLDYDVVIEPRGDASDARSKTNDCIEEFADFSEGVSMIEEYFNGTTEPTIEDIDSLYEMLGLATRTKADDGFLNDISNWSDEQLEAYVMGIFSELESEDIDSECQELVSMLLLESSSNASMRFDDGTKLTIGTCDNLDKDALLAKGFVSLPLIDDSEVLYFINGLTMEIADFGNNRYMLVEGAELESSINETRQTRRIAPVLGTLYAIISKIYDAKGAIDALTGADATPIEVVLNRFVTILNTISSELYDVDKEIERLLNIPVAKAEALAEKFAQKTINARAAIAQIKNSIIRSTLSMRLVDIERQEALVKLAVKGTKYSVGFLKRTIPVLNWITLVGDVAHKARDIKAGFDAIPDKGCNDNDNALIEETRAEGRNVSTQLVWYAGVGVVGNIVSDLEITGGAIGSVATAGGSLAISVIGIATKVIANIAVMVEDESISNSIAQFKADVSKLKFDCPKEPSDPSSGPSTSQNTPPNKKRGKYVSNTPDAQVHIDPAGFVYEAVPSNRVEGVQASIYYKETREDMYGDPYEEIVLWDAETYAQENPLFTDENGMYRWDVPQGLWQVKFEKDGYLTTFSDWLPVPPPQLEVNIGIVQNKQPEVTEARAYEEGIEVQFDKYMDLSTLTTDNVYVTANGTKLKGEIRMVDASLADEYADEEDPDALRYASRIRFVPEQPLSVTTGEIRLTVSRNVVSYAGIPMTENFTQVLDVEKEVQQIYAEDMKVLYGGEKELTVYAIPYEAAVGRVLHIANSSDLIASIDTDTIELDDEGKATIVINGGLPGRTQLSFSIEDVTAKGSCAVDVVTEIINAEAPKSSRASGTAVYRGTKIELTTDSKNGVIYFTTDGTCPCDENGTRRKYTVPIIIDADTQILAMTSVGSGEGDVSDVVAFNYTLKRSEMEFAMEEGWTWISHNLENAVNAELIANDESVVRVVSQTKELIRDPQFGLMGSLESLQPYESYKVQTTATTPRQRLSDVAWNPATPIKVNKGWNWIGYPVGQIMSVAEAFEPTKADVNDVIVGQNGFAQFDGENWIGTLETLSPGLGYLYQSLSDKNIVYNTSIVSLAAAQHASGISGGSALALDIHKYPSVMPIVATLTDMDGVPLDNSGYAVNAFCGTECRGLGRLINKQIMMNVYGDASEEIVISVTNADGSIEYQTNCTLDFGQNIVGSLDEPFSIPVNLQSGITEVSYEGDIRVNIIEDRMVITGIASADIDFVEIFDIDGHKILHENQVSESGIRVSTLGGGVYVVIVKGREEYTYHKVGLH